MAPSSPPPSFPSPSSPPPPPPPLLQLLLRVAAAPALLACAKLVTFSNVAPRRDASGEVFNSHDGTTQRFGGAGAFWAHTMSYPLCNETGKVNGCNACVYSVHNVVNAWSSPDLSSGSWALAGPVFPTPDGKSPNATLFRAQTVYNPATQLYVAWANVAGSDACPAGFEGDCYLTATAPAPGGPFSYRGAIAPNASLCGPVAGFAGDYALLVDDDGTGFMIFTHGIAGAGHRDMYVFKLSEDFLSFTQEFTGPLPGQHLVEAPAFFKRGSTFYALLGGCTCAGRYGGGVAYLTAPSALGPWTNRSATVDPGCPMWAQADCFGMGPGEVCNPVTQAQQNFVAKVPLADGSTKFVWTGDKWQTASDGLWGHDPQTWLPLEFDADGAILPLAWVDSFELDVAVDTSG